MAKDKYRVELNDAAELTVRSDHAIDSGSGVSFVNETGTQIMELVMYIPAHRIKSVQPVKDSY